MAKQRYLGPKVRRLRRERGLTQARMAERLAISASYLALIETNQRPVTVDLLLKVVEAFDVDLKSFAEDDVSRLSAGLTEVFSDPLFEGADISRQELLDLAQQAPAAASGIQRLYHAYQQLRSDAVLVGSNAQSPLMAATSPLERVGDYFADHGNYFPELEAVAEEVIVEAGLEQSQMLGGLTDYLGEAYSLRVRIMPVDVMGHLRRRYDRHQRRVLLSEMLPTSSRAFQLALQVALLRGRGVLDTLVSAAALPGEEAGRLARLGLANYLAAAILMPYDRFHRAAVQVRYDLEILQKRFEASFEQVCQRLTTLQRPKARGVPFFLLRVDKAGNVSKRMTAARTPFAQFAGACPRWNVHDAFRSEGRMHFQISETPDGERLFSLARLIRKPGAGYRNPGQSYALALGCSLEHAAQIVYADGLDLGSDHGVVPVGLHCRVCERLNCAHRAFPAANHQLVVDETSKSAIPYQLVPTR